ncbi:PREDICTED: uncharacterized protein LOC104804997 [Tarenaya hassleriana]|uniref:uncharacterized protein LOC104804997 n=1 Tax=Tarenaya hassleriana TaxID=28532 RepID=UPI00053C9C3E|nr:PREDICTED: uncharacterized protein LOC104804997 [Tarenaya hassleriana]
MGRNPSIIELVDRTYRRSDGRFVDPRAERVLRLVNEKLSQLTQIAAASSSSGTNLSPTDQDKCYVESIEQNKGRIYGLGGLQRDLLQDFGSPVRAQVQIDTDQQRRIEQLERSLQHQKEETERQMAEQQAKITNLEHMIKLLKGVHPPPPSTTPSADGTSSARTPGTTEDEKTESLN